MMASPRPAASPMVPGPAPMMARRRASARTAAGRLVLIFLLPLAGQALATETETLADGTRCTVMESSSSGPAGLSSRVTAGGGQVTASTTQGVPMAGTGSAASAGSSASSGSASGGADAQATSSTSTTRADGSVVTKNSDGTCIITRPAR